LWVAIKGMMLNLRCSVKIMCNLQHQRFQNMLSLMLNGVKIIYFCFVEI
jgi:hypothetical protein